MDRATPTTTPSHTCFCSFHRKTLSATTLFRSESMTDRMIEASSVSRKRMKNAGTLNTATIFSSFRRIQQFSLQLQEIVYNLDPRFTATLTSPESGKTPTDLCQIMANQLCVAGCSYVTRLLTQTRMSLSSR
ncbi:hypothetical protein Mapa_001735 [Marchantia paleacea]|nr:hypothetical protein Mapa_001735 [Marchantia paleacea]